MTIMHSLLCVGIVEFADPALLLIGDAQSLSWLADQIDARRELNFAAIPSYVSQIDVSLRLAFTMQNGHLVRQGNVLDWEISSVEAQQFAKQLKELAASTSPAHAYLDPESNQSGLQIVASIGEYDPKKVFGQ